MSNIIGLNTKLFGLEKNIKQSEPTRAANDLGQLSDPAGKERVLNPIVSESYMKKYIEEHGGGGGGDFSTATVTITNTTEENYYVPIPRVTERQGMRPAMIQNGITVNTGTSATIVVPLYHGTCFVYLSDAEFSFASCTGNISINGGTQLLIQGDGTVTI